MAKNAFDKFINKEATGAKKKEAFRQEKRKAKAQLRAEGEEFRRKKLEKLRGITDRNETTSFRGRNTEDRKPSYDRKKKFETGNNERPFDKKNRNEPTSFRGRNTEDRKPFDRKKKFETGNNERPFDKRKKSEDSEWKTGDRKRKPFEEKRNDEGKFTPGRKTLELKKKDSKPSEEKTFSPSKRATERSSFNSERPAPGRDFKKTDKRNFSKPEAPRYKQGKPVQKTYDQLAEEANGKKPAADAMPLNKFIAHAGISGRREAAEMVKEGKVQVNGSLVYEPGYKVSASDKVLVKGKQVFLQKNLVYILINKPKDYITTVEDPQGRKTVLDLIKEATKERVYPVGRLDRNTTGVLLLTNDGELAQKLTHPSFEIKKLYEVTLDKPLVKKDAENILSGITLEDGPVKADALGYADAKDKSVIGIEIHSGRNRIVRRIFEQLGYKVKNLDRVMFANLTKKNVERGKWRFLNEKEIRLLKYMNQSFIKKPA